MTSLEVLPQRGNIFLRICCIILTKNHVLSEENMIKKRSLERSFVLSKQKLAPTGHAACIMTLHSPPPLLFLFIPAISPGPTVANWQFSMPDFTKLAFFQKRLALKTFNFICCLALKFYPLYLLFWHLNFLETVWHWTRVKTWQHCVTLAVWTCDFKKKRM